MLYENGIRNVNLYVYCTVIKIKEKDVRRLHQITIHVFKFEYKIIYIKTITNKMNITKTITNSYDINKKHIFSMIKILIHTLEPYSLKICIS